MTYTYSQLAIRLYKLAGKETRNITHHHGHIQETRKSVPDNFVVNINGNKIERSVTWIDKANNCSKVNYYLNEKKASKEQIKEVI